LQKYYTTDIYQGLKLGANYVREHARAGDAILHLRGSDRLTFEYYIRDEVPMFWAWGEELEAMESGIAEGAINRVWVVGYQQRSTIDRMVAMYGTQEQSTDEQTGPSTDVLLRRMGLVRVEELAFPGENKLTLQLYTENR
jgi:hypothetical protein